MIKIKPVIFSAAAAFVLSFFTALISRAGAPVSLLKAVIFAVLFGGIATGIQFVCGKFLEAGVSVATELPERPKTVGEKVDFVVTEEELSNGDDAPSFALDSSPHILTSSDLKTPSKSAASSSMAGNSVSESNAVSDGTETGQNIASAQKAPDVSPAAFVPMDLAAKSAKAVAPAAAKSEVVRQAAPSEPAASPSAAKKHADLGLPEFGDLPEFSGDSEKNADENSEETVVDDGGYPEEKTPPPRHTDLIDGNIGDIQNVALMAQAIRTAIKE